MQRTRWKATLLDRYGVESIRAIPGLEERRQATLKEKYGAPNVFCKESTLYDDIERRRAPKRGGFPKGDANPMRLPEAKEHQQATLLANYGVPYPLQSAEIRERVKETSLERYGVEHPGSNPDALDKRRATCIERFGGPAPACSPVVMSRMQATSLLVYGSSSPCGNPQVQERRERTFKERYGVAHALQNPAFFQKAQETSIQRYGVPHAMQNPEVASRAWKEFKRPGPNKLERRFADAFPSLLYTGDGTFWIWLPKFGHKNPDFIVSGPDACVPKKGVVKVVEVFGDYWHSTEFTGQSKSEHEREVIDAFADVGIDCLVIWESDFKKRPMEVETRVASHLDSSPLVGGSGA